MCIVAATLQEAKEEEEIKFLRVWEIVGGRIGEGGEEGHDLKKAKQVGKVSTNAGIF